MNKKVCPKCGLEISVQNYSRHIKRCDGSGLRTYTKQKEPKSLICPYCGRSCKNLNSYKQHICRCKENPNRKAYQNFSNYIKNYRKGRTAQDCTEITKQATSLKKKYQEGFISPLKGRNNVFDYLYQEHNDKEIKKWLEWLKENKTHIKYLPIHHYVEGYEFIKREDKINKGDFYISQQENVIRQLFKETFTKCTIHHINGVRNDNRVENLLPFIDSNNHKRYHNSRYAYLIYDPKTHLFTCKLLK